MIAMWMHLREFDFWMFAGINFEIDTVFAAISSIVQRKMCLKKYPQLETCFLFLHYCKLYCMHAVFSQPRYVYANIILYESCGS